ncbi:uncharacterized protein A4U43_C07F15720 [Asparagus officinalis]|uniref:Uncharacterized protein n=1 Tax=Asparagus officinalis TaxID=4686 RepID=A0A5P1ECJ0_ASPOF|nr:uncharacterized protein A4U43_C07F15720 [Asparagus officinalis]
MKVSAGESPFILEDEDYLLKYKFELRDAVERAKLKPHSLFKGYNIRLAKRIQQSVDVLSSISKATGGKVAAKKGVWTFSNDWFMSRVMRQELDVEAPQFAESL